MQSFYEDQAANDFYSFLEETGSLDSVSNKKKAYEEMKRLCQANRDPYCCFVNQKSLARCHYWRKPGSFFCDTLQHHLYMRKVAKKGKARRTYDAQYEAQLKVSTSDEETEENIEEEDEVDQLSSKMKKASISRSARTTPVSEVAKAKTPKTKEVPKSSKATKAIDPKATKTISKKSKPKTIEYVPLVKKSAKAKSKADDAHDEIIERGKIVQKAGKTVATSGKKKKTVIVEVPDSEDEEVDVGGPEDEDGEPDSSGDDEELEVDFVDSDEEEDSD